MSKYNDVAAIIQVIGCVYNNPEILEERDKYTIIDEDFENEFHRVVFGSIYKLYDLGANKITLENILDFLSTRPEYNAIFKANKGEEWLVQASKSANINSFDYYYGRMKKMTLLRAFEKCGIDIQDLYDPDNILDRDKKQKQEAWLDNSTLQEIADEVDKKIEAIKIRYVDENYGEATQAADGILDLVDSFKKNPEVGVPLYGPLINAVTRGARLGKFYLRSAPTGIGKRIADYTPIPTPKGWKTVGEIQVGDYIFGKDGEPTQVLKLFKNNEKIWTITFSDGRKIDCCGEHLWEYACYNKALDKWETFVENTKAIYNKAKQIGFRDAETGQRNFSISRSRAVEYPAQDYDILPYQKAISFNKAEELKPYLVGSIDQRYDLLAGILDRNTTLLIVDNKISCEIADNQLAEILKELCYSLGIAIKNGNNHQFFIPFTSKIHSRAFQLNIEEKPSVREQFLGIASIEPTEEVTPMTCFTVDAEDCLFQVGNYIVTHNTRTMIADACYIACDQIFDEDIGAWLKNGIKQPTLYIGTEQDLSEVQTMMLAFLSGVNEEHILNGRYLPGEESRIRMASKVLQEAPLYIELLPDFSLQDIENTIKKNLRNRDVKYCFLDYIHTSMKILEEITRRSGGVRLREDNILFMLSVKLKDICTQYGVFIESATQLNGQVGETESPDQNLLRGKTMFVPYYTLS